MSRTTTAQQPVPATTTPRRGRRAAVVGVAVVAALGVWAVAALALDVTLDVRTGVQVQRVGAPSVVVATLVVGLLGWLVLAALERVTPQHAGTAWLVIGVVVLALSLLGPLGAVTGGAVASLALMHLVVGVVVIAGLHSTRRSATSR